MATLAVALKCGYANVISNIFNCDGMRTAVPRAVGSATPSDPRRFHRR